VTINLQLCESIARDFPQAPTAKDHWRNRARMHSQQLKCGDVFGDEIEVGKTGTIGADSRLHAAMTERGDS
jgi:hypothetical protein